MKNNKNNNNHKSNIYSNVWEIVMNIGLIAESVLRAALDLQTEQIMRIRGKSPVWDRNFIIYPAQCKRNSCADSIRLCCYFWTEITKVSVKWAQGFPMESVVVLATAITACHETRMVGSFSLECMLFWVAIHILMNTSNLTLLHDLGPIMGNNAK